MLSRLKRIAGLAYELQWGRVTEDAEWSIKWLPIRTTGLLQWGRVTEDAEWERVSSCRTRQRVASMGPRH